MIAVIADDFTGAAEIAGIGLRYGLQVELATTVVLETKAELFVVSTDSRSLSKEEAEAITANTIKAILGLKPKFIYKKIDSVLRGHVLEELNMQMQLTGLARAFVLPANPSLGRTIKDGSYFINGTAISETGFGTDPEFAVTDSSVLKMIRAVSGDERVLKQPDSLPVQGIVIGEAETTEEVTKWAGKVDEGWVLAGAGDFFTALLDKRYSVMAHPEPEMELPHLYISGTTFDKSRAFIKEAQKKRDCVAYLPASIMMTDSRNDEAWQNKVHTILQLHRRVIVAIDKDEKIPVGVSVQSLRTSMAKVVKGIIEREGIREIFIEGGSTAASILSELGITTFSPVNELKRGVVRMKAKNRFITVKPGSYELPEQIRKLYLLK